MAIQAVFLISVAVFTVVAAVWDLRTRRIPNALTVTAFALGLLFHVVNGSILGGMTGAFWYSAEGIQTGLLNSLAGFAIGFSILFVLWATGGGGGGDVKVMGALGAWLGWWMTLQVFFVSAVVIILMMIVVVFYRAATKGVKKSIDSLKKSSVTYKGKGKEKPMEQRRLMPYAVPLAVATWLVLGFTTMANLAQ